MAYTHVTSPLRHVDRLPPLFGPQLPRKHRCVREVSKSEERFINDAIKTWYSHRAPRLPIIPKYDAMTDRQAKAYFLAPSVQGVIKTTVSMEPPNEEDDDLTRSESCESLNKMSVRKIIPKTPSKMFRSNRETTYINDAIITNNKRTKYKDIIPKYDATKDRHSRMYFSRGDVRSLLNVTQGNGTRTIPRFHGRFALKTPSAEEIREREQKFINDAVITEKKKTRYWDMIPPYQGEKDPHSKKYFERQRDLQESQKALRESEEKKRERANTRAHRSTEGTQTASTEKARSSST